MNGQEQATLENFDRKLTKHIELSERRDKETTKFMKKVEPILKAHYDGIVVNEFLRARMKVFVGFLTVLAIIGSLVSVVWLVTKGK